MRFKQSSLGSEHLSRKLEYRINKCKACGKHRNVDVENNRCNYCHQRLKYKTPQADEIRDKIQNSPWYNQSYDGPLIKRLGDVEIATQKNMDFINGLSILEQEEIGFRGKSSAYQKREFVSNTC